MLHSWNWPSQGGQHGISSCCSEEQPWPPALGTLPTAPRASSNPPASPEDNTEELAELSCIQGWCFSLPRADVLRSKAAGQGSQGPQSGRWPQVLSATVQAWPEQQQLVAPALLNLHECDADEYERGDVAATAGAAAGAAPAPPCCPLLGRAHSLSPPAVLEQGLGSGQQTPNTAVEARIFSWGLQEGQRVPVPLSISPTRSPWVGKCHRSQRGRGTRVTLSPAQDTSTALQLSSPAASRPG